MSIVRYSSDELRQRQRVDRARLRATTDEEIARQIAADPDTAPDLDGLDPASGRTVHPPDTVDLRALRRRLGLTQAQFAARFGFSAAAVRNWEQGRRRPEGAARTLLKVIEREPDAVARALAG